MPIWYYHYKGNGGSARQQAAYMLNAIGALRAGEAIVIDDENEAKVNVGWTAEFTDEIKRLTGGLINVVYSNLSRFQNVDLAPLKERDTAAWVAKYGRNDGTVSGAGTAPSGIGLPIVMWQYTSAARIPGVTANTVDMNIFYGDVDQFKAYGSKDHVPAPVEPAPAPSAPGDGYYTVQSGDTLSGIGGKVGIDWRTIAATNGITAPYTIYPGQRLKVFGGTPGQTNTQPTDGKYTVVSGDTLSGIGTKLGIDWKQIADANKIKAPYTIYPGQVLRVTGSIDTKTATYTVQSGDSLSAIGTRTGHDWREIARANNIGSPYTIYPGQVLKLPGTNAAPTPTYTVRSGDTLSGIGGKTNVSWQTIARINGIGEPYTIYPGQVLKLK